ncbi:MAG: DUF2520 domain-containing protein [Bacteroidetes bacterium]|nr:DUF2520 domain-containing protein [Bacteroidota bacterium]
MQPKKQTFKSYRISIFGAGRLGSTLARHLHSLGNSPFSLISGSVSWLELLAADSHPVNISSRPDDLHRESNLIFLCVPDQELPSVVQQLANILFFDWQNAVVVHCSGAQTAQVLQPLARLGAVTAAMHPIQTFPTKTEPASRFSDIYWGIETAQANQKQIRDLVHDLGGHPVLIPAQAKALYHLACVLSSNYLVTLVSLSSEVLAGCGLPREDAFKMMAPLISGTLESLGKQTPEKALTGPIARGDSETIRKHVSELADQLPHLVPVYRSLASETVRLAVKKGTVSPASAASLMTVLSPPDGDTGNG